MINSAQIITRTILACSSYSSWNIVFKVHCALEPNKIIWIKFSLLQTPFHVKNNRLTSQNYAINKPLVFNQHSTVIEADFNW